MSNDIIAVAKQLL